MEDTVTVAQERAQRIAQLREYIDWLEAHPEAALPHRIHSCQLVGPRELLPVARRLGGCWDKCHNEDWFGLVRHFGPLITHELFNEREMVCKRVVVGVEEREVEEPDPDAVAALPKVKRVEKVEKVEWECPESLSALGSEAVIA